jgi:hypothetical protein
LLYLLWHYYINLLFDVENHLQLKIVYQLITRPDTPTIWRVTISTGCVLYVYVYSKVIRLFSRECVKTKEILFPWLKLQDLTKNFLSFLYQQNRKLKVFYLTFSVQDAYSTVIPLFKTECVQAKERPCFLYGLFLWFILQYLKKYAANNYLFFSKQHRKLKLFIFLFCCLWHCGLIQCSAFSGLSQN